MDEANAGQANKEGVASALDSTHADGTPTFLEYQAILEHAGLAILFTRDRRIYRCNRRSVELFGAHDEATLLGQLARVLFASDEDFAELSRQARPHLASGKVFSTRFELARQDSTLFKAHIVASAVDPANPRDGAIWIIEDVTGEHVQALLNERLLREYQLIFNQALVGILFLRERVIERCNRRLEELFGYPPDGLTGKSTEVLFPSAQAWEETGHRVYAAIHENGRFQGELQYIRHDGSPLWARVHGSLADPRAPDGAVVWVIEDITARHDAEQALLASHRQLETRVSERTAEIASQLHFFRQLIDAIPSPVFYKDPQEHYLGCNQAFATLFSRPQEDIVGRSVFGIADHAHALGHQAADRQLLTTPGSLTYESKLVRGDGAIRDMVLNKATFTQRDGTVGGVVGVMLDITERKTLEDKLKLSATVFDSTADGVAITDAQANIVAVNRAFTEITGYSEDEVRGKNPRILNSGQQDKAYYVRLWETIQRDDRWSGEIWNRRKDGSVFPEQLTISAVKDATGNVSNYVGVFSDITRLKSTQDALDFQAHHDALTGLPNRLLLDDRVETALQRAKREGNCLALMFIDLDRFKVINDTLGHHIGDHVLCEVSQRFTSLVRQTDTVARLGGDEFVILVEHIAETGDAARVADKVLEALQRAIRVQEHEFFIGASIGIAVFPEDGKDMPTLLKHADVAMYRAKDRGRNTFEFFNHEISAYSIDRFRMESDIRFAIERNELQLYFQPQFSLTDGRLIGAEALVRWLHPERGMVSPGQFIPLAEESGLIVPMGEWILRRACTQWTEWHNAGLTPGTLAVNVSGIEFRRGRVRESVEMTLAATRLPPELLELEITEGSIMNQAENSIQALRELRAMGVQIAVDDFGTGYSSLAYLKRLPLSKLKVDQSFVRGLPTDPEDCAIAKAIIALAQSLQLTTIAEGVETEAQREFLAAAGCQEVQGFLLGRPMPADAFRALLQQQP